ncbi:MAG: helix-turn-helix domain-containing protein [Nanoarchaeota archaeon]|nr:helix-turn-helix domain-containing protein [Nanoarchaeota archaeon]
MVKITKQQIKDYFKKHNYSTYADVAKEFNVCHELIRKKFKNEIISSLNYKSKYITYKDNLSFDSNNLTKINNIVFSKDRDIKSTVFNIVKTNDLISSEKLYNLFEFKIRQQVSQLIKTRKIFIKKQAKHSLYSTNPFDDTIIVKEKFDITSLKEGDKLLRDLQIINEIEYRKKIDVARKFNIDPKTINDIKKRFEIGGAKGLIHTRRPKTIKISSSVQAAIITEAVKHPEKSPKEIKKSVNKPISLKIITDTLEKIKNSIEQKKKLLLEIQ